MSEAGWSCSRSSGSLGRGRAVALWPRCLAVVLAASIAIATQAGAGSIIESKFELFVTNVGESVRFYEALGFEVAHAKPDGYTTMRSGSTVVALSPVPSWLPLRFLGFLRAPPIGTEIVLYADDLEAARVSLEAAGFSPGPIALQPWGDRDFRVSDHEGYYVRVSEGQAVPEDESAAERRGAPAEVDARVSAPGRASTPDLDVGGTV